jgi:hypothetical protein
MNSSASELFGPFQEIVEAIRDEVLVHAALRNLNAKLDEASVRAHRVIADSASTLADTKSTFGAGTVPQSVAKKLDDLRTCADQIERSLRGLMESSESDGDDWRPAADVLATLTTTAECARRLVEEVDHGKELLRRLADRETDVAQSRGLRAYVAYNKALGEVFPGAKLGKLSVFGGDGDYSIVAPIKLSAPLDGRTRARQEQKLHDRVEAQDPTLTGLLAFQYFVA